MTYPKIFLTFDNCFAIKRWVRPAAWMPVVEEIGARWVEASTDNECDPLFSTPEYLADWAQEALAEGEKRGIRIANLYTGYQTYRTVGLGHHDPRILDKLFQGWLVPMVRHARKLGAGLGFSLFAMADEVLQSPTAYQATEDTILRILSELVTLAWDQNPVTISFEQMYAPHQPPWTIEGSCRYLRELYARCHKPAYITIDVGHQVGQRRFLRPTEERILDLLAGCRQGQPLENVWLGSLSAYRRFDEALGSGPSHDSAAVRDLQREMDRYPYLFALERDGDTYAWREEPGAYSPIIHMQQHDGVSSHHAPFTAANNRKGIIEGRRLLQTLARSYQRPEEPGMPPRTEEIYLSFELFASNIDYNRDTIRRLHETLEYWRQFVPQDGLRPDELL